MPLHCAALRGHRALLELLLDSGSPIDAPTNSRGATALILAAGGAGLGEVGRSRACSCA